MPTYQYQCTDCGSSLEVRQSFSDDALTLCPECEGRLRKVFNAVGVVFKGSGFYRTDSRATPASSSSSSSPSESSSESSSDSSAKDTKSAKDSKSDSKDSKSDSSTTTKTTTTAA